jgi:hypothetical protein
MVLCTGMTDIYQVCDTHVNGVIKAQLSQYWSSEIARDPDHPVPITKMINQTTKILKDMPKELIRTAFDETAFGPATIAAEDDSNQIILLMDDLIDEIESTEHDWMALYNDIMSHFPIHHGQSENDEIEVNQPEIEQASDGSDDEEETMIIDHDQSASDVSEEEEETNECANDEEIAMALAGW